mgnify:CR=1 FL=1
MPSTYDRTDLSNAALKAWQNAHPGLMQADDTPRRVPRLNHDYDTPKETTTMTTPTPQPSPAEQFRADIKSLLDQMRGEIEQMHAEITQIRDGLASASQPATRPASGMTKSFMAVAIVHSTDDNGKSCYKLRGGCYAKNGVRVWPEVLPILGLDNQPMPMGITQLTPPINVLVEMHDYTDPATKETRVTPYKVIGLA